MVSCLFNIGVGHDLDHGVLRDGLRQSLSSSKRRRKCAQQPRQRFESDRPLGRRAVVCGQTPQTADRGRSRSRLPAWAGSSTHTSRERIVRPLRLSPPPQLLGFALRTLGD